MIEEKEWVDINTDREDIKQLDMSIIPWKIILMKPLVIIEF